MEKTLIALKGRVKFDEVYEYITLELMLHAVIGIKCGMLLPMLHTASEDMYLLKMLQARETETRRSAVLSLYSS